MNEVTETLRLLKNTEFGFRKEHSTQQQRLKSKGYVIEVIQNNQTTGLIVLDVAREFNRVWHENGKCRLFNRIVQKKQKKITR